MLVNIRRCVGTLVDVLISDSGGDVEIIVASNKEFKISPIREAFQGVFGKATVT